MAGGGIFFPFLWNNPENDSTFGTTKNGSVVQLVRIHACHAWGRGFESRPDRYCLPGGGTHRAG